MPSIFGPTLGIGPSLYPSFFGGVYSHDDWGFDSLFSGAFAAYEGIVSVGHYLGGIFSPRWSDFSTELSALDAAFRIGTWDIDPWRELWRQDWMDRRNSWLDWSLDPLSSLPFGIWPLGDPFGFFSNGNGVADSSLHGGSPNYQPSASAYPASHQNYSNDSPPYSPGTPVYSPGGGVAPPPSPRGGRGLSGGPPPVLPPSTAPRGPVPYSPPPPTPREIKAAWNKILDKLEGVNFKEEVEDDERIPEELREQIQGNGHYYVIKGIPFKGIWVDEKNVVFAIIQVKRKEWIAQKIGKLEGRNKEFERDKDFDPTAHTVNLPP